jgi:hypothetical protein
MKGDAGLLWQIRCRQGVVSAAIMVESPRIALHVSADPVAKPAAHKAGIPDPRKAAHEPISARASAQSAGTAPAMALSVQSCHP